jgi:hypothetical protein
LGERGRLDRSRRRPADELAALVLALRKTPATSARMWASALLFCDFRNSL